MTDVVIDVSGVYAGYHPELDILHAVSMEVLEGEIVTIVGANGAGKSTLLKAIMGWVKIRTGEIRVRQSSVVGLAPYDIARSGVGYVPQLQNVFPSLTVDENLRLGARKRRGREFAEARSRVEQLFPALSVAKAKQAGLLSGGQRQMLAMARALMSTPSVLLLDEPTAGLAPQNVEALFGQVRAVRDSGITVLMVEQNARRALEISDRGYVLDLGRNRATGPGPALLNDPDIVDAYLGSAGVVDEDS